MKSKLIHSRERAKQCLAFDDLHFGRCSPTDVDISIDFQGNTIILGEVKGFGKPLTIGQRLHMQCIVDGLVLGGKRAYAFLAHHNVYDPEDDVMVKDCIVHSIYTGDTWERPPVECTVHELLDEIHVLHVERGN